MYNLEHEVLDNFLEKDDETSKPNKWRSLVITNLVTDEIDSDGRVLGQLRKIVLSQKKNKNTNN